MCRELYRPVVLQPCVKSLTGQASDVGPGQISAQTQYREVAYQPIQCIQVSPRAGKPDLPAGFAGTQAGQDRPVASPPGRTYPRLPTMAVVSVPDDHRSEQVAGFARPALGYTAT
jgi:hypothetical protein